MNDDVLETPEVARMHRLEKAILYVVYRLGGGRERRPVSREAIHAELNRAFSDEITQEELERYRSESVALCTQKVEAES